MLRVNRTIGDTNITYESNGEDLKEDIIRCSWLTTAPIICGACGSGNLQLQGRTAKEFTFAEFICKDCYAKNTM